eukprot:1632641-Amphidinium_carterae.1
MVGPPHLTQCGLGLGAPLCPHAAGLRLLPRGMDYLSLMEMFYTLPVVVKCESRSQSHASRRRSSLSHRFREVLRAWAQLMMVFALLVAPS